MSNSIVRTALETRLMRAVPSSLPISYQNVAFEKPAGTPWIECFMIPTATLTRGVSGANKTFLGLFQVNVWVPIGGGMGPAESVADAILPWFSADKREPKYTKLSLTGASTGGSIDDPSGWIGVPVIINYRYDS